MGKSKLSLGAFLAFLLLIISIPTTGTENLPVGADFSWEKSKVIPIILVKPGMGGFVPVEGSSIGNHWKKSDVKPVLLVKPGIGGFGPASGSSIGNRWTKDNVMPVMLVEPSGGISSSKFVPLGLLSGRENTNTQRNNQVTDESSFLIESRIEGDFEGWDGETIFKLANGQIWQQVTYAYTYHYAYRPKVTIFKTHGAYKMNVDGVSSTIFVKQLATKNGEIDLYGADGVAVAYIVVGDKEAPIYLWSGEPVAYISGESIYGFNGKHIGWYRHDSIYDGEGQLVAAPKDKLVKVKEPEAKGAKKLPPLKGLKNLKPLKPLWGISFSGLPAKVFFLQGRK